MSNGLDRPDLISGGVLAMASHNRVILLGNVTREVELRHTPAGTAVTELGMAVNDKRKNQQGEWVEETTFVDVTLWGRTAEVAKDYLHKGSPVFVEGRLKLDTWEQEGKKRYKLHVIGEKIQLLGGRGENSGGRSGGFSGNRDAASSSDYYESDDAPHDDPIPAGRREANPTGRGESFERDDIPF